MHVYTYRSEPRSAGSVYVIDLPHRPLSEGNQANAYPNRR